MSEPVPHGTSDDESPDLLLIGVYLILAFVVFIWLAVAFALLPHLRAIHYNSTAQCQQSNSAVCK